MTTTTGATTMTTYTVALIHENGIATSTMDVRAASADDAVRLASRYLHYRDEFEWLPQTAAPAAR